MRQSIKNVTRFIDTPQIRWIALTTVFIILTSNITLFNKIMQIYPPNWQNFPFLVSLGLFFSICTFLFFLAICHGRATRWILAIFLVISALAAYYMDTYGAIIDADMLDNLTQTDTQEALGLINLTMLLRLLLLGLLPAWWLLRQPYQHTPWWHELKARGALAGILIIGLIVAVAPLLPTYTFYIHEHKYSRMYANPLYLVYSTEKFVKRQLDNKAHAVLKVSPTAIDAHVIDKNNHHELIIMVVGETARFDRLSLNGYHKNTNPELAKRNVLSLQNVTACGTSTGISVPCMFSTLGHAKFDNHTAIATENALDVLADNGVAVLWRDNNSDSKGVALRVPYQNFRSPTLNPVCDTECRDVGMLAGLESYIAQHKNKTS